MSNFKIYNTDKKCIVEMILDNCTYEKEKIYVCGSTEIINPDSDIKSIQLPERISGEYNITREIDLLLYLSGLTANTKYFLNFNGIVFSAISNDSGMLYICRDQPFPLVALPLVSLILLSPETPNPPQDITSGVACYEKDINCKIYNNHLIISKTIYINNLSDVRSIGIIVSNEEKIKIVSKTYYLTLGEDSGSVNVVIKDGTIFKVE